MKQSWEQPTEKPPYSRTGEKSILPLHQIGRARTARQTPPSRDAAWEEKVKGTQFGKKKLTDRGGTIRQDQAMRSTAAAAEQEEEEQWEGGGWASAPVDWVGDERKLGASSRFSFPLSS
jgi:hypothetical protein